MINPIYYENSSFDGGFYDGVEEPPPSGQPIESTPAPPPLDQPAGNIIEHIDIPPLFDDFLELSEPPAESPSNDKSAAQEWFLAQMYNQAIESAIANGADPRDLPIPMEYRFGLEARMGMALHEARVEAAQVRNQFVGSANGEIRRRIGEANERLRNTADPQERARLHAELLAELKNFASFMQSQVGAPSNFGEGRDGGQISVGEAIEKYYRTSPLLTTNATITTNVAQYRQILDQNGQTAASQAALNTAVNEIVKLTGMPRENAVAVANQLAYPQASGAVGGNIFGTVNIAPTPPAPVSSIVDNLDNRIYFNRLVASYDPQRLGSAYWSSAPENTNSEAAGSSRTSGLNVSVNLSKTPDGMSKSEFAYRAFLQFLKNKFGLSFSIDEAIAAMKNSPEGLTFSNYSDKQLNDIAQSSNPFFIVELTDDYLKMMGLDIDKLIQTARLGDAPSGAFTVDANGAYIGGSNFTRNTGSGTGIVYTPSAGDDEIPPSIAAREEVNRITLDFVRQFGNIARNIVQGLIDTAAMTWAMNAPHLPPGGYDPSNPYDPRNMFREQYLTLPRFQYESQMMRRNLEGIVDGPGIRAGEFIDQGTAFLAPLFIGGFSPDDVTFMQRWFYKPKTTGLDIMPAGSGVTTKFGDIFYSTRGTEAEQALALYHEKVHQFLTPKFLPLREFRLNIRWEAYNRSQLLRYLEEVMAESYAQMRVNGFKGLPDAIRFPLNDEKYSLVISTIVKEGAIGTIAVGGTTYGVYLVSSSLLEDE